MKLLFGLNISLTIESKTQPAAKTLGILPKEGLYFTPGRLQNLIKAQVLSSIVYCSHLWDGSAKYELALDFVECIAKGS